MQKRYFISFVLILFCARHSFAVDQKVFVELPGPCYELSQVDQNKAYFKSAETLCGNQMRVMPINIDDRYKDIVVYVNGSLYKKRTVTFYSMDNIRPITEKAERDAKGVTIPDNRFMQYGRSEAEKTLKTYQSPEFQERLRKETERVKAEIFDLQSGSTEKRSETAQSSKGQERVLSQNERIYIFISSSVPTETLRAYVYDINKISDPNVILVMRGFIGGMKYLKPTQRFVASLQKVDPQCDGTKEKCEMLAGNLIIDPLLFRKYNVSQVPAVVYAPNVVLKDRGQSEGKEGNVSVSEFFKLSGDVSLSFALNSIFKESKGDSLKNAQTILESGFYK